MKKECLLITARNCAANSEQSAARMSQTLVLLAILIFITGVVFAEDAIENSTLANFTNENLTDIGHEQNESVSDSNLTDGISDIKIENLTLLEVFPKTLTIGKAQLNLLVQNTGTKELKNLGAFLSGDGTLVSDVRPIEALKPQEQDYILVWVEARKTGVIKLAIRILDKTFYEEITVNEPEQETEKKEGLAKLNTELEGYIEDYEELEKEFEMKNIQGYAIKEIGLDDAKDYLRNTQAAIAKEDLNNAKANVVLLKAELGDIKNKLNRAIKPTKSLKDTIKENAILVSTIIGAILASFTGWEILKKKKDAVINTIKKPEEAKKDEIKEEQKPL